MAFWDVGTTNKLVGAPISGDQSALTEMQDWLDKKAKRERDEAEAQRKREELQRIGAYEGSLLDQVSSARNSGRIQQNLGRFRQAMPEGADASALEAEISSAPSGFYDSRMKRFFKGGIAERNAAMQQEHQKEIDKTFGRDEEDAKAIILGKAQSARQQAVSLMDSMGLSEEEKAKVLSAGDIKAANDALIEINGTRGFEGRPSFSMDDLSSKIGDMLSAQKLTGGGKESVYAKQLFARKGMATAAAKKMLDEQLLTESGADYGDPDTTNEEIDALYKGIGGLARLNPEFQLKDSVAERLLKEVYDRKEKRDLERDKREKSKDVIASQQVIASGQQEVAAMRQLLDELKMLKEVEDELAKIRAKGKEDRALQAMKSELELRIERSRSLTKQTTSRDRTLAGILNSLGFLAAAQPESKFNGYLQKQSESLQVDPTVPASVLEDSYRKWGVGPTNEIKVTEIEEDKKETIQEAIARNAKNLKAKITGGKVEDKPKSKKAKREWARAKEDGAGGNATKEDPFEAKMRELKERRAKANGGKL